MSDSVYKRVLLVRPFHPDIMEGAMRPPMGLGYLARALKDAAIEYDVFDMHLGYKEKHLHQKVEACKPDLIGFTMITMGYGHVYDLIRNLKRKFNIPIVAGGPHVSAVGAKVMDECPEFDFGVYGEGEATLTELCRNGRIETIQGLYHRSEGKTKVNPPRPLAEDLDSISFPTYDRFELDKYASRGISIITTRGCPYACIFCSSHLTAGKKFRGKSIAKVGEEIDYWYRQGRRNIVIEDDNFTFKKERVLEFCKEMEGRNLKDIEWTISGVRADKIDMEVLESLKRIGVKKIAFGVESASDKVLRALKKSERIKTIEKSIAMACESGLDVILYFLVGSPDETWDDLMDSVRLAYRYPLFDVYFFNLYPTPGTSLFSMCEKNDWFLYPSDHYLNRVNPRGKNPVFITPQMDRAQRRKALRFTANVRRTVRKRYFEKKLAGWGILAKLFASLFLMDSVQPLLKKRKTVRSVVVFFYNLFKKDGDKYA
jgi:radical SAM superfamily enzyme YgiQ (UPF0313 family)